MLDRIGVAFGEASTWRGMIMIATAFGLHFNPDEEVAIITAGCAIVGLIGVFTRRSSNG